MALKVIGIGDVPCGDGAFTTGVILSGTVEDVQAAAKFFGEEVILEDANAPDPLGEAPCQPCLDGEPIET